MLEGMVKPWLTDSRRQPHQKWVERVQKPQRKNWSRQLVPRHSWYHRPSPSLTILSGKMWITNIYLKGEGYCETEILTR